LDCIRRIKSEGVKQKAMKSFFITMLGLGAVLLAQGPSGNFRGRFHGPFHPKVVINEPYSATGVTTSKRTLSDGNSINETSCAKVYRDTSGRTRREETRNSATCSTTPQSIFISDPVASVEYAINMQNNTYRQFTIKTPPAGTTTPPSGTRPANPNQVETSLGTMAIPGTSLSAEGTQTVTTIPAGKFGNAQAITITSIRWYSSDLQIVVQSSRTDPRNGTNTYQLSNVSTAEPAETLFQLPSGLTLQQGASARGRRAP
jgi:hypothetical protein